jgi:hypothetical protein
MSASMTLDQAKTNKSSEDLGDQIEVHAERAVRLVAGCPQAKILAEKRQDMVLKPIRHGAGVRA